MKFEIKSRFSGRILFSLETESMKLCVEAAVKAGAYLSDADLSHADLSHADLSHADLSHADLSRADLSSAYLSDAYLSGAKHVSVGVVATDPTQPYERKPSTEHRAEYAARYRERHPEVPVVEALDAKLLQIIDSGAGNLNMSTWHTCETTHCRAGWAIHLAGTVGAELEARFGPQRAGAMIYRASTGRVPHFFASDERALADIREQAQQQGVA